VLIQATACETAVPLLSRPTKEPIQRLAQGEPQADVARTFNVSQATTSRLQVLHQLS
jgi:hypothetical protein